MTTMTIDLLSQVGQALYGERWQTGLASDLDVTDRTMRRWIAGDRALPDIRTELAEILAARQATLAKLERRLR